VSVLSSLYDLSTRLWVRLSLAFAAVALMAVLVTTFIGLVVFSINVEEFDMAEAFSVSGGPVDSVQRYIQRNPDGEGLELLLAGLQSAYPSDDAISITFSYVDVNGNLIFDAHPEDTSPWPNDRFDGRFPIVINNQTVGFLRILRLTAFEDWNPEDAFFGWLRADFGTVAIVGVAIGIIAGIIISRSMAAPLRDLAKAARAFGSGDFSHRVTVNGSAEVIQVGQAFNEMVNQIEQAESLRRNLVADVAHELRTPLTVLQGNLRAILDGVYALDTNEVANLYDQTRVLARLIKDLHDLAQAEARQLPLSKAPVLLNDMVKRITSTFAAVCDEHNVDLVNEIAIDLPPVYGDPARLSQVVNNLLTNALHHTPSGGKITVCIKQHHAQVRLEVSDTGKGIAPSHLPNVFERFYRADRSRSRNTGGAGLGLAIVKAIVEAHDGYIFVESSGILGEGTTFTVGLPIFKPSYIPRRALSSG
jgi:signal transduction histidine kinase